MLEKNNQPLVSVVIPCYNHEQFVQDSIQSVIDQSYQNIELIIIDDGSRDSSVEMIQTMITKCEKRFSRFEFRYRPNKGLSATLNEAIMWCEGEYYSALASDDRMLPFKTKEQVEILENDESLAAVFGGVKLIDEDDRYVGEWLREDHIYCFEEIILHQHELPAPTALLRLSILRQVGGYKASLKIEDWYMWLKISEHYNIFYKAQLYCEYRRHGGNFSQNLEVMHQERIKVLNEFKDNNLFKLGMKNALWMNASEFIYENIGLSIFKYFKLFVKHPFYFLRKAIYKIHLKF